MARLKESLGGALDRKHKWCWDDDETEKGNKAINKTSGESGNGKEAECRKEVKQCERQAEDLYSAAHGLYWSLSHVTVPPGVLWSSVSLSLPASVLVCLRGCRHAVCVSQRVKYTGIGSGVCVCTWTSLCLAFLQANKLRCKTTIRLKLGAGAEDPAASAFLCLILGPRLKVQNTAWHWVQHSQGLGSKCVHFNKAYIYCITINIDSLSVMFLYPICSDHTHHFSEKGEHSQC